MSAENRKEMFVEESCSEDSKDINETFYSNAAVYWSQIPATVDGMLGGLGFVSRADIKGSESFLKYLFSIQRPPGKQRALDCGSGIGRITKNLLVRFFDKVDLVEQNENFLNEAKSFVKCDERVGELYNQGLQNFRPEPEKYDVIWSQWVLGHLTDEDLVSFFKSCVNGLKEDGVVVVKENFTSGDCVELDQLDSSVTRPIPLMRELFKEADLKCIHESVQRNLPKGLYEVRMFALRNSAKC